MTIDEGQIISPGQVSDEEFAALVLAFEVAIQGLMNEAAQNRGYDTILTAVTYAEEDSVPQYQKEGKSYRKWRSTVWSYAYQEISKMKDGDRDVPTVDEFQSELPALTFDDPDDQDADDSGDQEGGQDTEAS